eukprot:m51a1_g13750 hypothetical protein (1692) ;mRNA; f:198200-204349
MSGGRAITEDALFRVDAPRSPAPAPAAAPVPASPPSPGAAPAASTLPGLGISPPRVRSLLSCARTLFHRLCSAASAQWAPDAAEAHRVRLDPVAASALVAPVGLRVLEAVASTLKFETSPTGPATLWAYGLTATLGPAERQGAVLPYASALAHAALEAESVVVAFALPSGPRAVLRADSLRAEPGPAPGQLAVVLRGSARVSLGDGDDGGDGACELELCGPGNEARVRVSRDGSVQVDVDTRSARGAVSRAGAAALAAFAAALSGACASAAPGVAAADVADVARAVLRAAEGLPAPRVADSVLGLDDSELEYEDCRETLGGPIGDGDGDDGAAPGGGADDEQARADAPWLSVAVSCESGASVRFADGASSSELALSGGVRLSLEVGAGGAEFSATAERARIVDGEGRDLAWVEPPEDADASVGFKLMASLRGQDEPLHVQVRTDPVSATLPSGTRLSGLPEVAVLAALVPGLPSRAVDLQVFSSLVNLRVLDPARQDSSVLLRMAVGTDLPFIFAELRSEKTQCAIDFVNLVAFICDAGAEPRQVAELQTRNTQGGATVPIHVTVDSTPPPSIPPRSQAAQQQEAQGAQQQGRQREGIYEPVPEGVLRRTREMAWEPYSSFVSLSLGDTATEWRMPAEGAELEEFTQYSAQIARCAVEVAVQFSRVDATPQDIARLYGLARRAALSVVPEPEAPEAAAPPQAQQQDAKQSGAASSASAFHARRAAELALAATMQKKSRRVTTFVKFHLGQGNVVLLPRGEMEVAYSGLECCLTYDLNQHNYGTVVCDEFAVYDNSEESPVPEVVQKTPLASASSSPSFLASFSVPTFGGGLPVLAACLDGISVQCPCGRLVGVLRELHADLVGASPVLERLSQSPQQHLTLRSVSLKCNPDQGNGEPEARGVVLIPEAKIQPPHAAVSRWSARLSQCALMLVDSVHNVCTSDAGAGPASPTSSPRAGDDCGRKPFVSFWRSQNFIPVASVDFAEVTLSLLGPKTEVAVERAGTVIVDVCADSASIVSRIVGAFLPTLQSPPGAAAAPGAAASELEPDGVSFVVDESGTASLVASASPAVAASAPAVPLPPQQQQQLTLFDDGAGVEVSMAIEGDDYGAFDDLAPVVFDEKHRTPPPAAAAAAPAAAGFSVAVAVPPTSGRAAVSASSVEESIVYESYDGSSPASSSAPPEPRAVRSSSGGAAAAVRARAAVPKVEWKGVMGAIAVSEDYQPARASPSAAPDDMETPEGCEAALDVQLRQSDVTLRLFAGSDWGEPLSRPAASHDGGFRTALPPLVLARDGAASHAAASAGEEMWRGMQSVRKNDRPPRLSCGRSQSFLAEVSLKRVMLRVQKFAASTSGISSRLVLNAEDAKVVSGGEVVFAFDRVRPWMYFSGQPRTSAVNYSVQHGQATSVRFRLQPFLLRVDGPTVAGLGEFVTSMCEHMADVELRAHRFDLEVSPVTLTLDYHPLGATAGGVSLLGDGAVASLASQVSFSGAVLELPGKRLQRLRCTWPGLPLELLREWRKTHLFGMVASSASSPVWSVCRLAKSVGGLVATPVRQYRSDGNVLQGVREGTANFTRTVAAETLEMAGGLFRRTQGLLEGVNTYLGTSPATLKATNVQARGTSEVIRVAAGSLAGEMQTARNTLLSATPLAVMHESGATAYLNNLAKALPIVVLRPMIGIASGMSTTLDSISRDLGKR